MVNIVKVGSELTVAGKGPAAVAALSTGGYAHAWFENLDGGQFLSSRPWVDLYDSNGTLLDSIPLADAVTSPFTNEPTRIYIDGLSSGFAATYTIFHWDSEFWAVQTGQIFDGAGMLTGNYNPEPGVLARFPWLMAQASLTNDNVIVVQYNASDELTGTIYSTSGSVVSTVDITTDTIGASFNPALGKAPLPVVESLLSDGFTVAWTDRSTLADGDNDGTAVKIRFFDGGASATTGQLLVNTSTVGNQSDAAMARLQNGNIVVVWTDGGGNGGDAGAGVKGQIFTSVGVKVGGEFIVNTTLAGNQYNAAITVLGNGAFVVVWVDQNPALDDAGGCVRGQLFSADGAKLGGEFLVNIPAVGLPVDPDVAAVGDSKFIVQWGNKRQMFDAGDIVAPVIGTLSANAALEYAANGAVVGTVSASDAGVFSYSLVNNAGGRFAINVMTGQITVADGLLLDFEQASSHVVRVRVTDVSLNASEQDFTINIVNRTPEFVVGDTRANTFVGGAGTDNLTGGEGGDLLDGGLGADNLRGGLGDDRYYVDNSGDAVTEFAGQGNDTVFTTVSYTLAAGSEVETMRTSNVFGTGAINLTGNGFANMLLGNAGNNRLDGKGGADDMRGFAGNDLYYVDNSGDLVTDTGGTDQVIASVTYALNAGSAIETLRTPDALGTANISLTGNEFGQFVRGNAGMNTIRGGGGVDNLLAGVDAVRDVFVLTTQSDSPYGAYDTVWDFVKEGFAGDPNSDKIDLRPIDADDDLAGNQAFRLVSTFTAPVGNQAEGQVRIGDAGAFTNVFIDLNGDNIIDMHILMKCATGLTAGDFWL